MALIVASKEKNILALLEPVLGIIIRKIHYQTKGNSSCQWNELHCANSVINHIKFLCTRKNLS